jgi:hypothetical protein
MFGIIRAVTSLIVGHARRCVRIWSATTLVTATRSLLRFLQVEGLISTPLVGAVPAVAGWRLSALPHPDGEPTGSQARIMPSPRPPQPPLTSTFTTTLGITRRAA